MINVHYLDCDNDDIIIKSIFADEIIDLVDCTSLEVELKQELREHPLVEVAERLRKKLVDIIADNNLIVEPFYINAFHISHTGEVNKITIKISCVDKVIPHVFKQLQKLEVVYDKSDIANSLRNNGEVTIQYKDVDVTFYDSGECSILSHKTNNRYSMPNIYWDFEIIPTIEWRVGKDNYRCE